MERETAAIRSEDDFLHLVDRYFPNTHPHLALGRGDDCAELLCPPRLALSTDLFLEDIHFRRGYFTPEDIGHKALAVNISDLAAAGAVPLGFSLGIMTPVPLPREDAEGILRGMAALAAAHSLALSGGDLSRATNLGFCVTVWGNPAADDLPFLRRSPVQPGDALFFCGTLGLAGVGLALLEAHGRDAMQDYPAACAAHLRPLPLVAAGQALARFPCRLMDISDGLARDLPRMLSACGAELTLPQESLHRELIRYARNNTLDPVELAYAGGEDYGLLGAVSPQQYDALAETLRNISPVTRLGTVTRQPGILCNGQALQSKGFDHFARAKQSEMHTASSGTEQI